MYHLSLIENVGAHGRARLLQRPTGMADRAPVSAPLTHRIICTSCVVLFEAHVIDLEGELAGRRASAEEHARQVMSVHAVEFREGKTEFFPFGARGERSN